MAQTAKILGQSNPSASTLTDVYTVPASTSAIVSSFVITNRSSTATSFRISVAPGGAPDSLEQYLYYDLSIPGNDTFGAERGVTLSAGDVIRVYAADATLSFNFFGIEIT